MDILETGGAIVLVVFVRRAEGVDNMIEGGYRVLPDAGLQSVGEVNGLISLLSAAKAHRNLGPDQVNRNPRRSAQAVEKLNRAQWQIGGAHANYNDLSGSIGQW